MKAFPLDMSQYGRLFGTTRIPQDKRDKLVTYEDSRHILVIHNGNFYALDVINEAGNFVHHSLLPNPPISHPPTLPSTLPTYHPPSLPPYHLPSLPTTHPPYHPPFLPPTLPP